MVYNDVFKGNLTLEDLSLTLSLYISFFYTENVDF